MVSCLLADEAGQVLSGALFSLVIAGVVGYHFAALEDHEKYRVMQRSPAGKGALTCGLSYEQVEAKRLQQPRDFCVKYMHRRIDLLAFIQYTEIR